MAPKRRNYLRSQGRYMTIYKQENREAFGKASGMKQAGTKSADNDAVVKINFGI